MKRPAPQACKLRAREIIALIEPPRTALTRLWLGTAGEMDYHQMAMGINVGHLIAQRVQRHSANVPYMLRGATAANAGWADVPAVDAAIQLFAAMVRTSNRRTLLAAYTQAVADASAPTRNLDHDGNQSRDSVPRRQVSAGAMGD